MVAKVLCNGISCNGHEWALSRPHNHLTIHDGVQGGSKFVLFSSVLDDSQNDALTASNMLAIS